MDEVKITIDPVGKVVKGSRSQSILESCMRSGVWLPHACTHGTCGTCKATLVDGEVDLRDVSGFALMDFEREEGKILLCQGFPKGDVVVEAEIEEEEGVDYPLVSDLVTSVVAMDKVTRDVALVTLRADREPVILPGQYFQWHLPGSAETRSFSVAKLDGDLLTFHIRYLPGGAASKWIFEEIALGDEVLLSGPYGRFFLREPARPLLFLAGGTGYAPIAAMLNEIAKRYPDTEGAVIFGARDRPSLYCKDELSELAKRVTGLKVYFAVSDESGLKGEDDVYSGTVADVFKERFATATGHTAYVSGPPLMVESVIAALYERRLFKRDIFREDFFSLEEHARGLRSPLSPFASR